MTGGSYRNGYLIYNLEEIDNLQQLTEIKIVQLVRVSYSKVGRRKIWRRFVSEKPLEYEEINFGNISSEF